MCFQLYAATTQPLPREKWELGSPRLPVESVAERDAAIKAHFSNPEIQFVGSTSGCGCDFPHVMFQNGGWPYYEDLESEPEEATSDCLNRERLVSLLRSAQDPVVELYGVWDGDFAEAPKAFETIQVEMILNEDFRFKERGFYRVHMMPD
jgi:hypothetical protein